MNFNINIYSIILLVISAAVGFSGGMLSKKFYGDNEDKLIRSKIIIKSIALLGIIGALIISIYF